MWRETLVRDASTVAVCNSDIDARRTLIGMDKRRTVALSAQLMRFRHALDIYASVMSIHVTREAAFRTLPPCHRTYSLSPTPLAT
eukprot:72767-Rhodomonas_salina.2